MKTDIHPKYYPNAKVTCACGASWTTGSTEPELRVELCSNCHPYFTGKTKLVDTAGRVDRFRARLARTKKIVAARKQKTTSAKKAFGKKAKSK